MLSRPGTSTRARRLAVLTAVVLAGVLAGCGSSDSTATPSSGSTTAADPSPTGASTTGSDLQATVASFLEPPKTIGITEPLSKKPEAGKYIVVVESQEPTSLATDAGLKEAADALGWKLEVVQEGTGPEDPARALGQALDKKPDAILISGNPLSTMRAQVERAKQENVIVVQSDSGEPVGQDGSVYVTSLDSFDQTGLWGTMIADYVAEQGSKHALLVDLSLYPILHAFVEGAQTELGKVSPDTKTTVLDVQIQDFVNGKVPSNIVSEIQRNPDIDFIVLSLGDMATGLDAALRSAGLADKVKIGGESAGPPNVTALKNDTQDVFTGFAVKTHGWRRADMLARIFNGDPVAPNNDSSLPTQLLTPENVAAAPLDEEGNYVGVEDFRDQYKALWQLTG